MKNGLVCPFFLLVRIVLIMVEKQKIVQLITPILESRGYVLWWLETCPGLGGKLLLRLYIDLQVADPGRGVNLADCQWVSEQVGALLEVEQLIAANYTLEVSSCGIERYLFKPEHYRRYLGQQIKLFCSQATTECRKMVGKLVAVDDESIGLLVSDDELHRFRFHEISKAKLVSDFKVRSL